VKTIAPKVDGYVEQLFVAFTGQAVAVNDSLLRIYSPSLVTAQEELLLAKKLAADVVAGSPEAVRNAESLLAAARRRLEYWDVPAEDVARVERTGAVQKTLTLRSPLGGVVVQKNVSSGQRVAAGDAVYQVADLREVWLEGEVFERDLAAVRLGEAVSAEFAAMPGRPRQGRIVYVSPTISPDTRTTKVRVALPNDDLALKPGMYATIVIHGESRAGVLSVPRSAVLATGTRVLVFVKGADGMLTPRVVELGANTDDRVEIRRGVVAGETVVSSATFLIDAESNLGSAVGAMANMPGMEANPAKPAAKSPEAPRPDPMTNMPGMDHPAKKP
jgi:Cu(I)/Ag(I) efflux system membrane fusion protein